MKMCVLVCRLRFQLHTASQFATLTIHLRFMSAIAIRICNFFMLAIHTFAIQVYYFFCIIIIITLWANSADNKLIFFLIFPEKKASLFHSDCLLGTLCLKCQTYLLEKHFKMSSADFFPRLLSINFLVVV